MTQTRILCRGKLLPTLSAIALTTAVAFTSCKKADQQAIEPEQEAKISAQAVGQTFSFSQNSSDFSRPGAGAEKWHYDWVVNINNIKTQDQYFRFSWAGMNPANGQYSWTFFDQQVKSAIDNGYKFSFGIMTCYTDPGGSPGIASFDGGNSAYPQWVHALMQKESVKDWRYGSTWVPNWNSNNYITTYETFLKALNAHLYATTYKNFKFSDVINFVDIRGFGNYGEWHTYPFTRSTPSAAKATTASLKRIIDAHKNAFPDFYLSSMIAGFGDGESPATAEVSHYLLTARNNAGEFGWRRDSWGNPADWANYTLLDNNNRSFNGVALKTLIMNKWKVAPITGEPCCTSGYSDLTNQIKRYHAVSFGNSNYGSVTGSNVIAASKAAGHRLTVDGGNISSNLRAGQAMTIALNWKNTGISPTYDNWNVVYELRNSSNSVVWTGTSAFKPRLFLPATTSTAKSDNFTLPGSIAAGTYKLVVIVKDPKNYRQPYPLAINGRGTDGSYTLASSVSVSK